jgi:hypothetical protein
MPTLSSATDAKADRTSAAFAMACSAEFGFVLMCCRAERNTRDAGVWEFLAESAIPNVTNWERVFELGEHHGVLPAMHRVLCVEGWEQFGGILPDTVKTEVERRFARLTRKNLRLAAELIHVLDRLDAAGVAAIPHKGPVLAEMIYGDLTLRDFSDLDVLVRAADIPRAKEALAQIGYKPNVELSPQEERAYLASGYEYTLDGPAGKNLLELQWNFVPRFFAVDFEMDAVFARAQSGVVAGRPVRALGAEDLFLSMCVHAAKHLWGRLCWLRDLAAVVKRVPMDWARVRTESKRLGVERILDVSLALTHDLLGTEAPKNENGSAAWQVEAEVRKIATEIARHIPNAEEYSTESVDYFRRMLRLRERSQDRWRFATRLLCTPSLGEWALVKLPEPLFPLYRGVRLVRVSGRLLRVRSSSASD